MAKKAKRKPNRHAKRAFVDHVHDRERQDLQRAIRHQKKIRSLNRQLSTAIRSADSSLLQLHDLLVEHPVVEKELARQKSADEAANGPF